MEKKNLMTEEKKWQKCQEGAKLIHNPSSAAPGFINQKCFISTLAFLQF